MIKTISLLAALALSAFALLGGCAPATDTSTQTGGAPLKTSPLSAEDTAKIKESYDKKHPLN